MPTIVLKIDSSELVKHANRLEKIKKSAFPIAVRGTLNKAAFNTKQKTIPASTSKHFVQRNKTFFKANSGVDMARGYDVKSMKSVVGFTPNKIRANPYSVPELEQQEYTGKINYRSLIPYRWARKGNSNDGPVLTRYRVKNIKRKLLDSMRGNGSRKARFVRAAYRAGRGGFVMGNFKKASIFAITGVRKVRGRPVITKIPIYSYQQGRSIRIKRGTAFMREATNKSAAQLNRFFVEEANRQYAKIK